MESAKNSMITPALTYAGIITGVYVIFSIIIDVMGAYFSPVNLVGAYVLIFIGLGYALYSYRKEYKANTITYGKAFGFGMLVALFLVIMLLIYSWIYMSYINPDILELSRDYTYQRLLERGLSESVIEDRIDTIMRFQEPPLGLIMSFINYMIFFTIFNLILAAFIKKEPSDPFAEVNE